ncbi:MAG: response regulator [Candidatus Cloacimonetes bacterium]|nr:response regulator [Candidatus Cloacimonadota bacterium]
MSDLKKILLVDDEQDSIEFCEAMLSAIGKFNIQSANNGIAGLQQALSFQPDLIVLDIQMPGMNGFQVFKELKKEAITSNIPVIMLTGIATTTGLRYDAKDMGVTLGAEPEAYIDKPVDPETFQKTVSKLLGI